MDFLYNENTILRRALFWGPGERPGPRGQSQPTSQEVYYYYYYDHAAVDRAAVDRAVDLARTLLWGHRGGIPAQRGQ